MTDNSDVVATGHLMMMLGLGARAPTPPADEGGEDGAPPSNGDEQEGLSEGEDEDHSCKEPCIDDSVGFKMLAKMGWSNGKGLGKMGTGIIDPVTARRNVYGIKGAGLRHMSETLYERKEKLPHQMEAWEREEKTQDWFKGSKSSMWLPAGLLEDQDKNFKSILAPRVSEIIRYEDAWEDREVSQFTDEKGITHADENWEDTWDAGLEMDLGTESLNSELFFSCTVVLGSRVRLLMVEPTGEIFQHMLWAHDGNSLRTALEHKLEDKLRVLRPLFRGCGDQKRTIYGILSRGGAGQANREAEKITGMSSCARLFGGMWLLCRSGGRYVRDYTLSDCSHDFLSAL